MISCLRAFLFFPLKIFYWWKRRFLKRSLTVLPLVSFGGVLDHQKIVHGGAVKLLSLRQEIDCDEQECNILYLVSSAQPPFAADLVRLSRRRDIPFVWNQNGVGYPAWAGSHTERHNKPMRWLLKNADYIIYQSQFCREAAEKFLGPSSAPSEILWNPVNLEKFFPLPERPPLLPLRLLTLGTHGYAERIFSTLECLKIIRHAGIEATLTIAGKFQWPHGEAAVRQKIEELQLNAFVKVLPPFQQQQAIALYQSHHIVLHPKYMDPCPTVVIEALASGCPVIGSATGGLPELITADCGILIPTATCWDQMLTPTGAELAEGVITLLPCWQDAAKAARARAVASFDEKHWIARHRIIFQKMLTNS